MNLFLPRLCFFILLHTALISFAQVQRGNDLDGEYEKDLFGTSVSINSSGDIIAVGSEYNSNEGKNAGHVKVFHWLDSTWIQLGKTLGGEGTLDLSGGAISLSDDGLTLAIGAKNNDGNGLNSGHVRIFEWQNNQWVQKGKDIDGTHEGDESGSSISLSADGHLIAIGALSNNGNGVNSGQLRVFEWKDKNWIQKGEPIYGESEEDIAGVVSLSKDGTTIAIGAPLNMEANFQAGQVRVYQWGDSSWVQKGEKINGESRIDFLGVSISLSANGNRIALGAIGNGRNPIGTGQTRIYEYQNSNWELLGQPINGDSKLEASGDAVALNSTGEILAIGASRNDKNGRNAGVVKIYQLIDNIWVRIGDDIVGEYWQDKFGCAISINSMGDKIVIGARLNDGFGEDSGHARVFDLTKILR